MFVSESIKSKFSAKNIINAVLLTIGGISLFFAQSANWINHIVFNQQAFTDITVSTITKEPNRRAISQAIVDKIFADRPLADKLIGDRSVNLISEMLNSDLSQKTLNRVASSGYAYVTSKDRQDIAVDLTAIKQPISTIVSLAESRGRDVKIDPSKIPDKITIINSSELPQVSNYIRNMLIAGLFLWLTVILTFSIFIFINRKTLVKQLYIVGSVIIGVSILALFTGPFLPSIISSFVNNINLRTVVTDLASAYLSPFYQQLYLTILITSLTLLAIRFRWIFIKSWQASYQAINKKVTHK